MGANDKVAATFHGADPLDQIRARLRVLLDLHKPVMEDGKPVGCNACDWEHSTHDGWPCPTATIIHESLGES